MELCIQAFKIKWNIWLTSVINCDWLRVMSGRVGKKPTFLEKTRDPRVFLGFSGFYRVYWVFWVLLRVLITIFFFNSDIVNIHMYMYYKLIFNITKLFLSEKMYNHNFNCLYVLFQRPIRFLFYYNTLVYNYLNLHVYIISKL